MTTIIKWFALWFAVSVPVGLLIARMLTLGDEQ